MIAMFAALLIYQPTYQVTYAQANLGENVVPIVSLTLREMVDVIRGGFLQASGLFTGDLQETQNKIEVTWNKNENPDTTDYVVRYEKKSVDNCVVGEASFSNSIPSTNEDYDCTTGGSTCTLTHSKDTNNDDNGLDGNTCYCYSVSSLNSDDEENPQSGQHEHEVNADCTFTLANIPGIPQVNLNDDSKLDPYNYVTWNSNGNGDGTEYNIEATFTDVQDVPIGDPVKIEKHLGENVQLRTEDYFDSGDSGYDVIIPNTKLSFSVAALNHEEKESSYSQESEDVWSPVNIPGDPLTDHSIGTNPAGGSVLVSWDSNNNPDYTEYVVCRTPSGQNTFTCVGEDPAGAGVALQGTGGCPTSIDEVLSCPRVTGNELLDTTAAANADYIYKVKAVNEACLDNDATNNDECFISVESATSLANNERGWSLDFEEDFREGTKTRGGTGIQNGVLNNVAARSGSNEGKQYGNGGLGLLASSVSSNGEAIYTFDPSEGLSREFRFYDSEIEVDETGGEAKFYWSTIKSAIDPIPTPECAGTLSECYNNHQNRFDDASILKLRIVLDGSAQDTPVVEKVRVYYELS